MEEIKVNAEFLFELKSKHEWVNKIPDILPGKTRAGESWVWLDKNNNVFERGADFIAAENHDAYPCRVYRLVSVDVWAKERES